MRVRLYPTPEQSDPASGIGRVVMAQYKHLPEFDIQLVEDPRKADLIAAHTQTFGQRVDVIHCHGLYWTGDPGSGNYSNWHTSVNTEIIAAIRQAEAFSVPSEWVSMPFRRDMLLNPQVIGHGIDLEDWEPQKKRGKFVLWNKNRSADVCDPMPAYVLSKRNIPVWSTFAPEEAAQDGDFRLLGRQDWDTMRRIIHQAQVYLATTKETFGIGTLEAMAAGVPVLGFDWGGTRDLVTSGVEGILVDPYDYDALEDGYHRIIDKRRQFSQAARAKAELYSWQNVIGQYADLYRSSAGKRDTGSVAVVIPCHNYEKWVAEAVESVLRQSYPVEEIVVIDDGSTDNSLAILQARFGENPRVRIVDTKNRGVAAARNMGIGMTSADFVVCLDADDRLGESFVAHCRQALLEDPQLGIAYTGLCFIKADGTNEPYDAWPPAFDWKVQSTPNNPPYNCVPSAAMFRRKMWIRAGGYRQEYAPGEDAEFWTNGLSTGFTARRITKANLFEYRAHPGSASKTKKYKPIDAWKPWMRDRIFPLGVPTDRAPEIQSYSQPNISVIIPIGPDHAYLASSAIESLMGQTFRNWELITVNDTGKKLDLSRAPYRFPFARQFETAGTLGAGAARNLGAKHARAPWILFLDADDYLAPDALNKLLSASQEGYFVYSDWVTGKDIHKAPEFDCESYSELLPIPITSLIERSAFEDLGGFDENLPAWEDWDLFLGLVSNGLCGKRVPEPLLVYRVDTGSRRKRAKSISPALKARIQGKHIGGNKMSCGGCGNGGNAVMEAKREFDGQAAPRSVSSGSGFVRIEYSGVRVGGVTYFGRSGRSYRFGNNPIERINDVHPEDVDVFLGLEGFRVLGVSTPTAIEAEEPAPIQMTDEELEAENAALEAELAKLEGDQLEVQFASPAAEKLAAENNLGVLLEIQGQIGSGKDGAFTVADIRQILDA